MPATPRSNQNRRISSCSRRTSGWSQFRSGWSDANRCRYHSPGVPSGLVVRVHVVPEKGDGQAVGISSPPGPRPSRNQNRARSGEPGGESIAAWNQACSTDTWLGTMSTIVRIPTACGLRDQALRLLERAERGIDRPVVRDVVAAVGERGAVPGREPDRIDAQVGEVGEPRADAREVADAVAVAVREAARVDLVDDGVAPPRALVARRGGCRLGSGRRDGACRREELAHEPSASLATALLPDGNTRVAGAQTTRLDRTMQ